LILNVSKSDSPQNYLPISNIGIAKLGQVLRTFHQVVAFCQKHLLGLLLAEEMVRAWQSVHIVH
jgi:hypothetical protein